MVEFLGGTYDKQLSITRREAPRNNLLMRLAGADLGCLRGQRVSSTLRPRKACLSMQRRRGVPGYLKPTDKAGTYPAQASQDNVGNDQKNTHRKKSHAGGGTGGSRRQS